MQEDIKKLIAYSSVAHMGFVTMGIFAGTTQGVFVSEWQGDVLYGRNEAVGGHYILAYAQVPEQADLTHRQPPQRMLLWHANYHPDGGQLFYPVNGQSFVVPLALPGDDISPEKFVSFRCDGRRGLYIHPNIWHGALVPFDDQATFLDRQGRVHARVSVDFPKEFGCYLGVPTPERRGEAVNELQARSP